jgi:DNA-binding NarL/FixJ family response regulator
MPSQVVGLVANEVSREALSELVERQGFVPDPFACVQAICDGGHADRLSAVVVVVQDTIASVPGLLQLISGYGERTPVVIVYTSIHRWEVRAALAAGAVGVIDHDELEGSLGPCLHAVLAGQVCVPRAYRRQIEPPVLSTREKQILGLVVMGYMNSQIAARLFLAESTVKSHLSSAFGKLGVRSRNEAVDLILDPERGLGTGILALGGEPVEAAPR